jgi:uncharacterized membrane protein YbhN (UPF0104 family)
VQLTLSTILSHLALFFVLLLALRDVGVSEHEISTAQVLGVFAFGRLLTTLPLTPGGLGIVELSYIGGLILAGRSHADVPADLFHAQVAAAVLVFRALTYGVQVPIGRLTYLTWRARGLAPVHPRRRRGAARRSGALIARRDRRRVRPIDSVPDLRDEAR